MSLPDCKSTGKQSTAHLKSVRWKHVTFENRCYWIDHVFMVEYVVTAALPPPDVLREIQFKPTIVSLCNIA